MTTAEKIKTINNKVGQSKSQCNLDRQTAKISALSSGNVSRNELLNVLLEKELLEKAAKIKKFEYSPIR